MCRIIEAATSYERLGIPLTSNKEDINKAYKRKAALVRRGGRQG